MKTIFYDLGDGTSIAARKVVLILNAENATKSAVTRKFMKTLAEKNSAPLPKKTIRQVNSLILANAYGKDYLYSSSRQAKTLAMS